MILNSVHRYLRCEGGSRTVVYVVCICFSFDIYLIQVDDPRDLTDVYSLARSTCIQISTINQLATQGQGDKKQVHEPERERERKDRHKESLCLWPWETLARELEKWFARELENYTRWDGNTNTNTLLTIGLVLHVHTTNFTETFTRTRWLGR